MMWTNRRTASVVLTLLVLHAGSGSAAPPKCNTESRCNDLLELGKAAHNQKDYVTALYAYQTAYSKVADPILLVLEGRTQFRKGDAQGALDLYLRAEKVLKFGPDRQHLAQYIAEAKETLLTPLPAPIEPSMPADLPRDETPALVEAAQAPLPLSVNLPPVVERPVKSATPLYKRWWLWTVVGVAAAGVGAGLGLAIATVEPSRGRSP